MLGNIGVYRGNIHSIDIILNNFTNSGLYHDSLSTHFGNAILKPKLIPMTSAYETLKSMGVDLISNDSLRRSILNMLDNRYKWIKENGESEFLLNDQYILNSVAHKFDKFEIISWNESENNFDKGNMIPRNYSKLKNDLDYIGFLKSLKSYLQLFISYVYIPVSSEMEMLINNINQEINRLEK
jgi:hypothetical protein